jgi:twitching motility protein PilT
VTQREIGPDSKSFSYALRAALREKPDIIMVGELRDAETIETASIAANSGHLVFSTTHARSASEAVRRILESMPEGSRDAMRNQLSSSLIGVIAQTLVSRADGKGKVLAYEIMSATPSIRANIASGKFSSIYSDIDTGSLDGNITMEKCLQNLYISGMITKESAYLKAANPDKMRTLIG